LRSEIKKQKQVALLLENFSRAVISGDVESMRQHFSSDVVSYGTRALVCLTIEELVSEQWSRIWGKCLSWEIYSIDTLVVESASGYVAFRWNRVSIQGEVQTGRATLIYEFVGETLVVLHSHFSESPEFDNRRG
jgi:hypothetical protein